MPTEVEHDQNRILLGDEAVALGAVDAGISAAYAYPGTPSTEIFASRPAPRPHTPDPPIRGLWSTNEKVALEEGVGVSYAGKRALVAMKHVGLNVAADPFMNVAVAGAHGGLVIAVADDPSMHSSQNEQDSRFFADFAQVPCLEPSDQQECYDFTREAFELSERLQRAGAAAPRHPSRPQPRASVDRRRPGRRTKRATSTIRACTRSFRRTPAAPTRKLLDKQPAFAEYAEAHAANCARRCAARAARASWSSGVAWNYLRRGAGSTGSSDYNVLRIGVYPLPVRQDPAAARRLDRSAGGRGGLSRSSSATSARWA